MFKSCGPDPQNAADSIVAYLIGIIPFIDIFAEERARVVELLLVNVSILVLIHFSKHVFDFLIQLWGQLYTFLDLSSALAPIDVLYLVALAAVSHADGD